MRKCFISGLIVLSTLVSASASDRYPNKKRYVNQIGEIVTIGQVPQIAAYAPVRPVRVLPPVQIVPLAEATPKIKPARASVAAPAMREGGKGLFSGISVDPADWPSGRTCCRPGEPYFNENPNS
jgi:hypothetical protein